MNFAGCKTRFEVKGMDDQLSGLSRSISEKVMGWLKTHK